MPRNMMKMNQSSAVMQQEIPTLEEGEEDPNADIQMQVGNNE